MYVNLCGICICIMNTNLYTNLVPTLLSSLLVQLILKHRHDRSILSLMGQKTYSWCLTSFQFLAYLGPPDIPLKWEMT